MKLPRRRFFHVAGSIVANVMADNPSFPATTISEFTAYAKASPGCTTSILLVHGFTSTIIAERITTGLATAKSERMRAGQRTVDVTRVRITDAGRAALER